MNILHLKFFYQANHGLTSMPMKMQSFRSEQILPFHLILSATLQARPHDLGNKKLVKSQTSILHSVFQLNNLTISSSLMILLYPDLQSEVFHRDTDP